ncbi:MAG: hypothetical protein ACUVS4_09370 [Chloroflexaceae bacterium]
MIDATQKSEAPLSRRAGSPRLPDCVFWSRGAARRWLLRTLGLLVALQLGLLVPLTCVFHCFLEARAERAASAWFLCGARHTEAATIAGSDVPTTIAPRAWFELLAPAVLLFLLAGALILTLSLCSVQPYAPPPFPPPTPPPRPGIIRIDRHRDNLEGCTTGFSPGWRRGRPAFTELSVEVKGAE